MLHRFRFPTLLALAVAVIALALASSGGSAQADAGDSVGVCCAWNAELNAELAADADLTYKISGGDEDAQAVLRAAVEEWEVVGITLNEIPGKTKQNINIKFKRGGGVIAGQALRKFDDDGNIKQVDLTISGRNFGDPNNADIVGRITKHEMGHALGTGHANFDGDLLSTTVGAGISAISTCDVNTVLAANHWKLVDGLTTPHAPHDTHVHCGAVAGGPTVSIVKPDDGDTFASGATILFKGTATDSGENDISGSLVWTSDIDDEIGTGGSFSTKLSNGSHVITASVTVGEETASDSITIGVGLRKILVDSIECVISGNRLRYTITVVADKVDGDPVEGATVSGTRLDPRGRTFRFEGDTNQNGQITFRASRPKRGDHVITVESVVEPGFQFDATLGESIKTCAV